MASPSTKKATHIVKIREEIEEDREEGLPKKRRKIEGGSLRDTLQQHYGDGGGEEEQPVMLTSVRNLLAYCEVSPLGKFISLRFGHSHRHCPRKKTKKHADLSKIFKGHTFVGSATSTYRSLFLFFFFLFFPFINFSRHLLALFNTPPSSLLWMSQKCPRSSCINSHFVPSPVCPLLKSSPLFPLRRFLLLLLWRGNLYDNNSVDLFSIALFAPF